MTGTQQSGTVEDISGQPDYYVNHLAEVNKSNDVISTQDICNKNGVLLVRSGLRINHDVAQKILQHKLIKPLEQQIQIDKSVSGATLNSSFAALLEKHPDLRQVHGSAKFNERFKKLLGDPNFDAILIQKITVLQDCNPQEFEKALFCAWLCALVAVEMGLTADLVNAAFLAGLVHDVGFLHLPPDIINKSGELSVAEWRTIQSHVVVGQFLIRNMKGVNQRAAIAVLEHHERCDGTGYPAGKMDETLDVIGQIVGMVDSIHALRMNQFAQLGRNLCDTLPYLRMNAATHFVPVFNAMHSILKKSGLAPTRINPLASYAALVEHLAARGEQLKSAADVMPELSKLAFTGGTGQEAKKLQKVTAPVLHMMSSSGLLREEILQWLAALRGPPDESALEDLIEMELMQNELCWQLGNVQRTLRDFLDKQNSQEAQRYQNISGDLAKCLEKK